MATPAVIGALRVTLGADTAQFERGMKEAQSRLSTFSSGLAKAGAAVGAALAGMAAVTAVAVRGVLTEADKLTKMGRAIGVPVQELSALKHAAELSGMSIDSLRTSMQRFARNMAESASDAQSTAARAFAAIGVSVKNADGTLRSSTEVMGDVAEKFKGMQDGAGKTALAMQLFGKSGADMINMLNNGRDGLQAMMQEARDLGIVIDKETGAAAERFNDNLDRLNKVKQGFWVLIASKVVPTLEILSQRMLDVAKDGDSLKSMAEGVAGAFRQTVIVAERVIAAWAVLKSVSTNFWESLKHSPDEALKFQQKIIDDYFKIVEGYQRRVAELNQGGDMAKLLGLDGIGPKVQQATAPIVQSTRAVAESLAAARAQLTAFLGTRTEGLDHMAQKFQAVRDAFSAGTLTLAQYTQMMAGLQRQLEDLNRSDARNALTDLMNEATVSAADKMAALRRELDAGTISLTEYGRTMKRVQEENVNHWHALASTVSSALTTIFGKSKTAAIASAVINTAQGITRNLAQYPQPFAGIMAAITAAAGAAQIRAIKSTSQGGGGGGGGGASAPAAPAIPQQQTLFVQGISKNQFFDGDMMRSLIEELLNRQRDGAHVLLK